ncbi:hypothetical protein VTK26DRAFT_9374 [Humicola hyalothermophila]
MASVKQCIASLARLGLSTPARPTVTSSTIPKFLLPSASTPFVRHAHGEGRTRRRKKRQYPHFRSYDLRPMQQFSLCDAMRYIRAIEVGHPPATVKYELAVKLRTNKNGPKIRNSIRLPFPVKSDTRIGVICPEDSPLMVEAQQLGAVAVGQESLFESIRAENIPFNRLICHADSQEALKKANLGKILGPRGLMPSPRTKTITTDLKKTIQDLIGSDDYRERDGVVRMAVGQLGFTPQMLADNVKAFLQQVKQDIAVIAENENHPKALDEVVLSSTNGPGLSLDGSFFPKDENLKPEDLQSAM